MHGSSNLPRAIFLVYCRSSDELCGSLGVSSRLHPSGTVTFAVFVSFSFRRACKLQKLWCSRFLTQSPKPHTQFPVHPSPLYCLACTSTSTFLLSLIDNRCQRSQQSTTTVRQCFEVYNDIRCALSQRPPPCRNLPLSQPQFFLSTQ